LIQDILQADSIIALSQRSKEFCNTICQSRPFRNCHNLACSRSGGLKSCRFRGIADIGGVSCAMGRSRLTQTGDRRVKTIDELASGAHDGLLRLTVSTKSAECLRSRGEYGSANSNFDASHGLTVPLGLQPKNVATANISCWREMKESELIVLIKKWRLFVSSSRYGACAHDSRKVYSENVRPRDRCRQ
jgi:hypothetical protein